MIQEARERRRRGRPPGPGVDPQERRRQLLDAAESAIRASGPDVGLADVAAQAGLTRSAVYAAFTDRNALLDALAHRHARLIVEQVVTIAGGVDDPAEQTRAAIGTLATWFEDEPELARALSAHLPPVAPAADGMVIGTLTGILVGGFTSRGLDPGPAQTWAHALVGAISSTITWWSATRTISRDEVVDHLFLLIWSGFSGMDTPAGDAPLP